MTQSMAIQRRDLITRSKSQKNTTHMPLKERKEQLCSARIIGIQSAHLLQSFMDVGAYTSSSNRNTDEAADAEHRRPQGQKAAKEQRKGKGKGKLGKGDLRSALVNGEDRDYAQGEAEVAMQRLGWIQTVSAWRARQRGRVVSARAMETETKPVQQMRSAVVSVKKEIKGLSPIVN
uniref:Uncharacterized protein n=1 Tax=Oryza sativa subsp. japonica TaxID=39947 RepID=Q2R4J3_ORYSJ|nr:hypothetical protein LOC_Os11g28280 [Oryza sativa Japonica Group]